MSHCGRHLTGAIFDSFSTRVTVFRFSEEVQRCLGFDWVLLFLRRNLHRSSVVLATRLLLSLFNASPQHAVQRFREGSHCGGWLAEAAAASRSHHGLLLGVSVCVCVCVCVCVFWFSRSVVQFGLEEREEKEVAAEITLVEALFLHDVFHFIWKDKRHQDQKWERKNLDETILPSLNCFK